MVTSEERITRLEAVQEANAQHSAEVMSLWGRILNTVEAARQEARDMSEATRKEAREDNDAVRKEDRIIFLSPLTLGVALFGTVPGASLAG